LSNIYLLLQYAVEHLIALNFKETVSNLPDIRAMKQK